MFISPLHSKHDRLFKSLWVESKDWKLTESGTTPLSLGKVFNLEGNFCKEDGNMYNAERVWRELSLLKAGSPFGSSLYFRTLYVGLLDPAGLHKRKKPFCFHTVVPLSSLLGQANRKQTLLSPLWWILLPAGPLKQNRKKKHQNIFSSCCFACWSCLAQHSCNLPLFGHREQFIQFWPA